MYLLTCSPGWTGQNCQQDINECAKKPCQHGRCVNKDGGYKCACSPGWTGQNCSQDIDECARKPCQHGTCVNKDGGYKCSCSYGWTGQNCQQDVNECSGGPCRHGDCENKDGGYMCTCRQGWTGQNCQQDIDECARKPCLNDGGCRNQDGGYRCNCRDGWTGQNCQIDVDECASNTCPHAECVNIAGGYGCTCFPGWTGQNCDQEIECQSGWYKYNIHCYKTSWITDEVNWSTASSRCQHHGAILASIKDLGGNNFIADLISKQDDGKFRTVPSFWIGLHKESEQWKWTDGSRVDYSNWAPLEPNDSLFFSFLQGEDCGSMYYKAGKDLIGLKIRMRHAGQWNDDRCSGNKAYICEKPI